MEDGFLLHKSLNAALVNTEPLSKTISLGMPCVVNIDLRAVTVVDLVDMVAVLVILTSIHFEYASTTTRNMCPNRGAA